MKGHDEIGGTSAVQVGTCTRCRGLMVPCFTDALFLEIAESTQSPSWHCVNCGEWLDETILSNRQRMRYTGPRSSESASASSYRRWKR
ncbi:MAG: hypothetical protein OEY77_09000 [Nitrospira sp.]|nr:hypothetical protein [Nitrospira sp.]